MSGLEGVAVLTRDHEVREDSLAPGVRLHVVDVTGVVGDI